MNWPRMQISGRDRLIAIVSIWVLFFGLTANFMLEQTLLNANRNNHLESSVDSVQSSLANSNRSGQTIEIGTFPSLKLIQEQVLTQIERIGHDKGIRLHSIGEPKIQTEFGNQVVVYEATIRGSLQGFVRLLELIEFDTPAMFPQSVYLKIYKNPKTRKPELHSTIIIKCVIA